MPAAILIIEPRQEVANALSDVVASAQYVPVVRPYVDRLADVGVTAAAIIVRVSFDGVSTPPHMALDGLAARPPVVAIVWDDAEYREAQRLRCEVILRAPQDIGRLCDALAQVVHA